MIYVSIGKVSEILGVAPSTLRAWEKDGKIHPTRTPGGHRRYLVSEVENLFRVQEAVVCIH